MKFGMRRISAKRMIKSRTTAKVKRSIKKSVIPGYGSKPPINLHPVKSVKRKIYRKTTFSFWDLFK
jgi:hypothetical protein